MSIIVKYYIRILTTDKLKCRDLHVLMLHMGTKCQLVCPDFTLSTEDPLIILHTIALYVHY